MGVSVDEGEDEDDEAVKDVVFVAEGVSCALSWAVKRKEETLSGFVMASEKCVLNRRRRISVISLE